MKKSEDDRVRSHRILLIPLIVAVLSAGCSNVGQEGHWTAPSSYVGGAACTSCHQAEAAAWEGSHHDLAMQPADAATVLGDFDDTSFTHRGVTTVFGKRGDAFVVRTEGPGGVEAEYEVSYVFGVDPLQQYLIELDRGRYQAFTVAWDTRAEADGGQRWFHLYPDEQIEPDHPLHWTAPSMTWNWMCAECHSTDLRKNFDPVTLAYETTWSDIDVSCEACHGPGSRHVDLANEWAGVEATDLSPHELGFGGAMAAPAGGWVIDPGEAIAHRTAPLESNAQVDTCAHCHARRSTLAEGRVAGTPIHDSDVVRRLDEGLYHPDGQILDEVYVYGSFVQSKMYAAGVRCSDCHEPHSLELIAAGNALCSGCHLPAAYDTPEHHRHPEDSSGAKCVECHMAATTYMVVDARRDHSMRIPRPHLSERLRVPNACNGCHVSESVGWATQAVERWYGQESGQVSHFGDVLAAGRVGAPGAAEQLRSLAVDPTQAGIVRATALSLAALDPSPATLRSIEAGSVDPDPFLRLGALDALEAFPSEARLRGAFRLLRDSIRSVRVGAARVLAPVDSRSLSQAQRSLLAEVTEEYVGTQLVNLDHPAAHVNLGNLRAQQGMLELAERAYLDALRVDSTFLATYLNLADLYRAQGREVEARSVLTAGLRIAPDEASLHHAMGLALVRAGQDDAIEWLARAVELAPEVPRLVYVLAVALNSDGDADGAIAAATRSLASHPYDRELHTLLALLHRDRGEFEAAKDYTERLLEVAPDDAAVAQLLTELGGLSSKGHG